MSVYLASLVVDQAKVGPNNDFHVVVDSLPSVVAVNVHDSQVGAAGAQVIATLPAVATKFNYVDGFVVTCDSVAAALAAVTAALSGLEGGDIKFRVQPVVGQGGDVQVDFANPRKAAAVNQAVTLTVPAIALGPVVSVSLYGHVA